MWPERWLAPQPSLGISSLDLGRWFFRRSFFAALGVSSFSWRWPQNELNPLAAPPGRSGFKKIKSRHKKFMLHRNI